MPLVGLIVNKITQKLLDCNFGADSLIARVNFSEKNYCKNNQAFIFMSVCVWRFCVTRKSVIHKPEGGWFGPSKPKCDYESTIHKKTISLGADPNEKSRSSEIKCVVFKFW